MPKNQVQFRRGMSLRELLDQYGTREQCEQALFAWRWPRGFVCPECGHTGYCTLQGRRLFQCQRRGRQTSVTAGTLFADSKLALNAWFLAMHLITQAKNGISSLELSRQLGISQNSAWLMKHKLMQAMLDRDVAQQLADRVQIDDAYCGGRRRGYKRGRGTRGKSPFVAAVETNAAGHPRRMSLNCVKGFRSKEIVRWSRAKLAAVSTAGCTHAPTVMSGPGLAQRRQVLNRVDTMLGNVKNAIHGTYLAVSPKHLPRYLAEFSYRFNRRFDLASMPARLATACGAPPGHADPRSRLDRNARLNVLSIMLRSGHCHTQHVSMSASVIDGFWGKARPFGDAEPRWHPLAWHMLDVAACAEAILHVRPSARRVLSRFLNINEPDAIRLAVLMAALHDIGKFAAPFQQKAMGPVWPFTKPFDSQLGASEHDRDGLALWRYALGAELVPRIWPDAARQLEQLIGASVGHHGRAVDPHRCSPAETFRPEGLAAAQACASMLVDLLLPEPIKATPPDERKLAAVTFWFAGFVTISDWAGSSQALFPYCAPDISLHTYWRNAHAQAMTAVGALGLATAAPSAPKSFASLTGISTPTPLQTLVESVELGEGPVLVVIEDVTGAGKTEAAQVLVHRLMASGRVVGAYWAMPTQATANAMYVRQRDAIAELFADGARPQLSLAHGGARLHEGFQETILRAAGGSEDTFGVMDPDETATAACAAFLADDARAALIADIGAGTIDQAILGVLPARFQAVRLFGLSDKVLVVDEAHAYDAYVCEELKGLLQFQAALGGSAVVLSATLPRDVQNKAGREQLVRAWLDGCGARMSDWRGRKVLQREEYPLVTVVTGHHPPKEAPVEAASWSQRSVPVRFVEDDDAVIDALTGAARDGAAVAWVRNTVDDALAAAAMVQARGLEPIVFHARFTQEDRQRIEASVMARLGPAADPAARHGAIVVATQVIEQSLDLDFDLMASDLAPVDLLVQRAGRLRRHKHHDATRPRVPFELMVKAPPFDDDPQPEWLSAEMRKTEFVYQDPTLMWRTMRALRRRGVIETPGGLRGLIEEVYGADADIPPGLDAKAMRADGAARAEAGQARQSLLSLTDGYRAEQVTWVAEERVQVQTRLSAAQTTLRLARVAADGSLRPWAEGDCPPWKQWALSEVKVSAYRAPLDSQPLAQFRNAADAARRDWGKRERERKDLLLLPLELDRGIWSGAAVGRDDRERWFTYGIDVGLRFS